MAQRPMLGDLELELVQRIDAEEDLVLTQHAIPGLEGDFLQSEGRRAARFTLTGLVTGEEAATSLDKLRDEFARATPVPFVSDVATAIRLDKVLIEEFGVREIAGRPERFEYAFTLREFTEAAPPEVIDPVDPIDPIDPIDPVLTTLEVEVIVEGQPDFDFSQTRVYVDGQTSDGRPLHLTLTDRANNIWTRNPMEPGHYTFSAANPDPEPMSGSLEGDVVQGVHPNRFTIRLRPAPVGETFVVHYRFDRSLLEPCMRHVLQRVVERINAGPADERIIIVGHTDKTGSDAYNQSLSERRARGVFAFLTFGANRTAAIDEWDALRKTRAPGTPNLNDSWGVCEYQYMLQDLGFYHGRIDAIHGPITTEGLRRFQASKGLPATGAPIAQSDGATWRALIEAYLAQDSFNVPPGKFLPNCSGEILKWLGHGELDWVANREDAWRPNRRTEIIFVRTNKLPCTVPPPDTFNLPAPGAVNGGWCLGPGNPNHRFCWLKRPGRNYTQNPPAPAAGAVQLQPAEPGTTGVQLRLEFEDGRPAANMSYVLIAPDGEYLDGEGTPVPTAVSNGRKGRTGAAGTKTYPDEKPIGTYTLEIDGAFVARLKSEPGHGKGNVVCAFLRDGAPFEVVLTPRPSLLEFVDAANPAQVLPNVRFGQPFRLRAEVPGETRDEIVVELTSYLIKR